MESNRVCKEACDRRQRRWKVLRAAGIGASVGVAIVVILFYAALSLLSEYNRTDGAIENRLTLNNSDPKTARQKAPTVLGNVAAYLWQQEKAPTVLGNVAAYLGHQNGLDRLTELLKRAAPVITEQYRMDQRVGAVMPQVGEDTPWPLELRYTPARSVDTGRLLSEWRRSPPPFFTT